jgi:hypothetical protein
MNPKVITNDPVPTNSGITKPGFEVYMPNECSAFMAIETNIFMPMWKLSSRQPQAHRCVLTFTTTNLPFKPAFVQPRYNHNDQFSLSRDSYTSRLLTPASDQIPATHHPLHGQTTHHYVSVGAP